MRNNKYPFIVIGGGISGMTAAIYLKRAGYDVMILEREIPGGQINRTAEIDNYPGFLTIDGPSLAMNVYQQTQKLNIPMIFEDVLKINKEQEIKIMTKQNEYICDRLIIATGRMPRKLELRDEEKYIGHGISYCALCDGALYKNSDVIIYHIPYSKETENMICKDSINKMKKGVYIINVSRGGIVNNKDLLEGLKSGHIGGAALDVYSNEIEYVNKDIKDIVLKDEIIEELFKMDNVIITPHFAFYTDEALLNMVSISIDNIFEFKNTGKCINQIKNI